MARDAGFKEAIAKNPNVKVVALVNGKVEEDDVAEGDHRDASGATRP